MTDERTARIRAYWGAVRERTRDMADEAVAEQGIRDLQVYLKNPQPKKITWVDGPEEAAKLAEKWKSQGAFQLSGSLRPEYAASAEKEGHEIAPIAKTIVENCSWVWLSKDEAILVRLPLFSSGRDEQGCRHAESGPALDFGKEKHYEWHGVIMPAGVMENPGDITADMIRQETNVEVRRVMLVLYGMDRYLHETKARIVQEDSFGTLLEIEWGDGAERFVRYTDVVLDETGKPKEGILPVLPEHETAHEAVAWSYGRTPETYNPVLRT